MDYMDSLELGENEEIKDYLDFMDLEDKSDPNLMLFESRSILMFDLSPSQIKS